MAADSPRSYRQHDSVHGMLVKRRGRSAHRGARAAAGGSIGAWMGMKTWHHKTQHKKFCYGVPLIMLAQTALVVWCIVKG